MEHITPSICVVKTIITDDMLYESQEDVFGQLENLRQKFGRIDKDFNLSANPVDNSQPNHFNRPPRYLRGRFCLFFPHIYIYFEMAFRKVQDIYIFAKWKRIGFDRSETMTEVK